MTYNILHKKNISPKEAIEAQKIVKNSVIIRPFNLKNIKLAAGVDVSVKNNISKAAVVVLTFPELRIIETKTLLKKTPFPYIPGLLSFREGPVVLECISKLKNIPDIFIFDAQGLAHPRKAGLACHMGVILNKPSIGAAKSRLYGSYKEPGLEKASYTYLFDDNKNIIGAVTRTRKGVKPIFVSPGHMADVESSVNIILALSPRFRIPETTRAAHNAASLTN